MLVVFKSEELNILGCIKDFIMPSSSSSSHVCVNDERDETSSVDTSFSMILLSEKQRNLSWKLKRRASELCFIQLRHLSPYLKAEVTPSLMSAFNMMRVGLSALGDIKKESEEKYDDIDEGMNNNNLNTNLPEETRTDTHTHPRIELALIATKGHKIDEVVQTYDNNTPYIKNICFFYMLCIKSAPAEQFSRIQAHTHSPVLTEILKYSKPRAIPTHTHTHKIILLLYYHSIFLLFQYYAASLKLFGILSPMIQKKVFL
eukprot:GHVR01138863.1.p1 GENE.GHVR01138863.1~~GHVR01138863.1.p1  ORF type:complete len:259 (-),score=74.90 GHVR01138863.1:134-910(-)